MTDSGAQITDDSPRYWSVDGEPTLLLGGSSQDNLFQVPGVAQQLDAIADAGGNYVLEASQNSKHTGQRHYDNANASRERATDPPRPVNNVKIYGTGDGTQIDFTGSEHDAVERFWRNIFAGHAASRFHRPPYGIGINARVERMLQSARAVTNAVHPAACEPRTDLLSDRSPDEAYALADPGRQYAVYFPRSGSVILDVADDTGLDVQWYDVEACRWADIHSASGASVRLDAPYRNSGSPS